MSARFRLKIEPVRAPVLYSAYRYFGKTRFSRICKGILQAAAEGTLPEVPGFPYRRYSERTPVSIYLVVSPTVEAFLNSFPEGCRREVAQSLLSIRFVNSMEGANAPIGEITLRAYMGDILQAVEKFKQAMRENEVKVADVETTTNDKHEHAESLPVSAWRLEPIETDDTSPEVSDVVSENTEEDGFENPFADLAGLFGSLIVE